MRIGFISTRLNGSDGVSGEVANWTRVLRRSGHELYYCAGELGGFARGGSLIPRLHHDHQSIVRISRLAFGNHPAQDGEKLRDQIYTAADELRSPLRRFIRGNRLDLIVVENALTLPMNLPLGVCLTGLIAELGIPTIAHHHDFFWERQRYRTNAILDLLDTSFPAKLGTIRHVTVNSVSQRRLVARRGIDSVVVPNVLDFNGSGEVGHTPSQALRRAFKLDDGERLFLQPTRVLQRKGIEMALELISQLDTPGRRLFIPFPIYEEGLPYWEWLQREAQVLDVELCRVDTLISTDGASGGGNNAYPLAELYTAADLITYPSSYEGFGNVLLEAIYHRRLCAVNRYPVYNADIRPLGFQFIELPGFVNSEAVDKTSACLADPEEIQSITEHNLALAREYFSLEVLERRLNSLLEDFAS